MIIRHKLLNHHVMWRQEGVAQYAAIAADLQRVLPASTAPTQQQPGAEDALQALPGALTNLHGLLMHVAARLDGLHERLADAKQAHLEQLAAVRVPCCPELVSVLLSAQRESCFSLRPAGTLGEIHVCLCNVASFWSSFACTIPSLCG